MIAALSHALTGLKSAAALGLKAAETITRAGTSHGAQEQEKAAAPPLTGLKPLSAPPEDSLLTGAVDLLQAEHAYKANAKVVSAAAEMEREVIDILS